MWCCCEPATGCPKHPLQHCSIEATGPRLWLLLQCQLCRWRWCTGLAGRLLEEPMAGPLDGHSLGWAGLCRVHPSQ